MTSPNGAMLYTQGFGSRPENVEIPAIMTRAPTAQDTQNGFLPIGKRWIDQSTNAEYVLTSYSTSGGSLAATWVNLGSSAGVIVASGTTAAMSGNPAQTTITSSFITTASRIIYSRRTAGGGLGDVEIASQVAGSAVLESSDNTETSTFDYIVVN